MRHNDIRVGDTLKLRKDNSYGLPPLRVFVTELRYRRGYKVPFVMSGPEAYRPKDFAGHA